MLFQHIPLIIRIHLLINFVLMPDRHLLFVLKQKVSKKFKTLLNSRQVISIIGIDRKFHLPFFVLKLAQTKKCRIQ